MAWSELTETDVKARMSVDEIQAIEDTGGGDDRLAPIMEQVTAMVRGKVAGCDKNTMGTAGTIPAECKHAACSIVRHDLMASLPVSHGNTEARNNDHRNAMEFLDSVASCDIGIEGSSSTIEGRANGAYGGDTLLAF